MPVRAFQDRTINESRRTTTVIAPLERSISATWRWSERHAESGPVRGNKAPDTSTDRPSGAHAKLVSPWSTSGAS